MAREMGERTILNRKVKNGENEREKRSVRRRRGEIEEERGE